jgi:hypothetical protein
MLQTHDQCSTKAGVSVLQMATMLQLSVRRFYQLLDAGVFPLPLYLIANRKPIYTEEQQRVCLEVRRRQCGVNGAIVFFHSPRATSKASPKAGHKRSSPALDGRFSDIREGLKSLGFEAVTEKQIEAAITHAFPSGTGQVPEHEVIREVFLYLNTVKKSANNVGG